MDRGSREWFDCVLSLFHSSGKKGKQMNTIWVIAAAVLVLGSTVPTGETHAQQTGIKRTDVQRNDLDFPGREVIMVRVDFAPGVAFARHSHPGAEIAYVLQGTLEYQIDRDAPVTLSAGQSLFIPAGAIHTAKNNSTSVAAELATYVVEKDKPLVLLAD